MIITVYNLVHVHLYCVDVVNQRPIALTSEICSIQYLELYNHS